MTKHLQLLIYVNLDNSRISLIFNALYKKATNRIVGLSLKMFAQIK